MIQTKIPSTDEMMREALFVPCDTKEHLHTWIKVFLGIDIPDCIVCSEDDHNPPSNSCPMDLIWEIYSKARYGKDKNFTQVLGFSARDAFKTLSAAVIETLCLFHLNRDVGHMAALEAQAKNCQRYIESFLKRPVLKEYITSKNKRQIEVTRYESLDKTKIISPIQYNDLDPHEQSMYQERVNTMKIVIATVADCNGLHVPFFVCDELDLADPAAFEESKMIPNARDGVLPITFLTSTRKYSFGLVQQEIDKSDKTRLNIRHWNLIDVTEACPPEKHMADQEKIPIYYSENQLRSVSQNDWQLLSDKEKEQFSMKMGHPGCLHNCKIFAQCQGRLINKQTSKSSLLKPLDHVEALFDRVSVDYAKAQLMCWKPSSEGLIYPYFSRDRHMLLPYQIAEKVTGEEFPKEFTKSELVELFKRQDGIQFYSGLDWGFTHNFAVVTAALIGHILYVFDVISVRNLELQQKLELCKEKIKPLNPIIYPDNAYPADNKTFKRNGFKMIDFRKDVLAGIEGVRVRLTPGSGKEPTIHFLKEDLGCELVASKILRYHWKVDDAGNLTDEPDKNNDDELDALRYLCQNVPVNKSKVMTSFSVETVNQGTQNVNKNWMKDKIRELTADGTSDVRIYGKPGGIILID